jgi:hypothetical protein
MSERALRNAVIRLAHDKPELREDLLPLVSKEASEGADILYTLVGGQNPLLAVHRRLSKEDKQSADLLYKVMSALMDKLDLDRGASEALSRLQGIVKNGSRWNAGLLRNNVFKAANSLGIKLPSGMF